MTRRAHLHNTDNTSSKQGERIAPEAEFYEDTRRIVQNGVDSSYVEKRRQHNQRRPYLVGTSGLTPLLEKHSAGMGISSE